ncbi:lytic transglycosylase domain-containing protein [Rahnella perminowiae]|uniref:lytic transglycosylase domain-containing protein n=1 Tax=Rahnella perminowiae TaxID=2816244 RepID=UPI00215C9A6F|nr:lytic transglycosylase domain-containing protein [Rahnella perminowiae]MCR8998678.1 lytic transglycosylase domain-containing protein [Rahnella perminowiae]
MLGSAAVLGLAMRCAATVHPDTVNDIARTESGFNQYAIGVVGQKKGIFPENLSDAIQHVNRLKLEGKNYSVGLMQINQSNFSRYGVTAIKLFDPCTNLSVFEKIITDCYLRGGSLVRALSCYYAGNFITGQKPEKDFSSTSYVQRIGYNPPAGGYTVPSTKEEQQQQNNPAAAPQLLPPAFESWDILREYPRPASPQQPTQGEKKEEKKNEATGETRTG